MPQRVCESGFPEPLNVKNGVAVAFSHLQCLLSCLLDCSRVVFWKGFQPAYSAFCPSQSEPFVTLASTEVPLWRCCLQAGTWALPLASRCSRCPLRFAPAEVPGADPVLCIGGSSRRARASWTKITGFGQTCLNKWPPF